MQRNRSSVHVIMSGGLSTTFVLTALAAVLLGIQGGLRVRGDQEQLTIFIRDYHYPPRLMPMLGATQVAVAILTIAIPSIGIPAATAMATVEASNHIFRQRIVGAAILDFLVISIAFLVAYLTDLPLYLLAVGAAVGATGFFMLHRRNVIRTVAVTGSGAGAAASTEAAAAPGSKRKAAGGSSSGASSSSSSGPKRS